MTNNDEALGRDTGRGQEARKEASAREEAPAGDFDMMAAALRADASDEGTFLDVLAGKLAGALPDQVQLTMPKKHALFTRSKTSAAGFRPESVVVTLGDDVFTLTRKGGSRVSAYVTRQVRGITLKTEDVDVDEWITRLSRALAGEAARSERSRKALGSLLT